MDLNSPARKPCPSQRPRASRAPRARREGPEADEYPGRGTCPAMTEAFYRSFDNRRQLAAFADCERRSTSIVGQGVSGQSPLRQTIIQLAWFWPIHQPNSALTRWYLDNRRDQAAKKKMSSRWRASCRGAVAIRQRRRRDRGAVLKRAARRAELREERTFFPNPPSPINLSRSGGEPMDAGLKSRSRARPPEPTACESGIRASLKRDDRMGLFRLSTRTLERLAQIEGFEQPERNS